MATIRNVLIRVGVSERGATAGIKRLTKSMQGLVKTSASIGKIAVVTSAAVGGLSALAGAGAVSATSMLQLGAALAPLAGLLAALPGAAATAIASMVVLKMALYGVSDAMKAAYEGNAEKFEKALAKLTPSARSFAREFRATVPALKQFQRAAQDGFFSQLNGSLKRFVGLLKSTQPFIRTLAAEMGQWARSFLVFATAEKSVKQFSNILGFTRGTLKSLREALYPFLHGFLDLAEVGAQFFRSIAPGIAKAISGFGQWLSAISASGKAMEWMKAGLATLKQLGRIAANIGVILVSVFKAAGQSGGGLLGTIEKVTSHVAEFLESAKGAQALKSIFSGIGQIGTALAPVFVALVKGIAMIAPAIGRIAIAVGPVLTTLINAVAPALAGLEPGITAIVKALGGAAAQIIPAVGRIAAVIGPIVAQALTALGPAITALEPGITALVQGLGGAITALAPALLPIATAIAGIAVGLAPVLPALGQLIAMLALGLAAHITRMLPVLPGLVQAIITLAMALGQGLLDALIAISPQMPALVTGLTDLLLALVPAIPSIIELALVLVPLIPIFADIIVLVSQLVTAVMPSFITALDLLGKALGATVAVVEWVWPKIYGAIKWAIDLIGTAISGLSTLPKKFGEWFGKARDAAADKLNGLLRFVSQVPGKITGAFRDAGTWLYNAGKNILVGLWNGIASMADKIAGWIGDLVKRIIPGPVRRVLGIASPSKVFHGFGVNLGQGLVAGMQATYGLVSAAAAGLAGAAMPELGMAGAPGMGTPVGVTRSAGTGARALDYERLGDVLSRKLVGAMRQEGVGASYLDGDLVSEKVSRRQGRATESRRRTG